MIDIEKVRTELHCLHIDIKDAFGNSPNYDIRIIEDAINELERLQAKEKPTKVLYHEFKGAICPSCESNLFHAELGKMKHCWSCDIKLDWSKE